jgi:hypothetical protein
MSAGTIALAEVAARLRMLQIVCNRCDRHGRLNARALLDRHGNQLAHARATGAAAPRRQAMEHGQLADVCGIEAPALARLF